jgi:hypothetical protein
MPQVEHLSKPSSGKSGKKIHTKPLQVTKPQITKSAT